MLLATKLKNQFTELHGVSLKNIIINGNKRGCSGFITKGGRFVYVNTESLCGGYLYRTAENAKDYTGGRNNYARDLNTLVAGVNQLLS